MQMLMNSGYLNFYPVGGRSVVLSQENALHTRLHAASHVAQSLHDPGHAGNRGDFLLFTLVSMYNGKDVQINSILLW